MRTLPHTTAILFLLDLRGGVCSCAAADCSARPEGRWMLTLPHTTAILVLLDLRGGVRSCAAADCSARPKGRWMLTLPHTAAILFLLDLRGRRSLVCGCRLLCAPERALNAYAAARDGTALPTCREQDAFARVRLPTALRARKGAGCVCCRTRLNFSACLIFAGGVRSCAAADCSARPKGRWKRTLPHRTALLCPTALLAGKSAGGVSRRIQVVFFASL